MVNKPFYEEILNDSPSLFRSKLFFFGRNAFCNMMAISKAMGLMNQTTKTIYRVAQQSCSRNTNVKFSLASLSGSCNTILS